MHHGVEGALARGGREVAVERRATGLLLLDDHEGGLYGPFTRTAEQGDQHFARPDVEPPGLDDLEGADALLDR